MSTCAWESECEGVEELVYEGFLRVGWRGSEREEAKVSSCLSREHCGIGLNPKLV